MAKGPYYTIYTPRLLYNKLMILFIASCYKLRSLLFYEYSRGEPNFLRAYAMIFQLYKRIAGVEFYLIESNLATASLSPLCLRMYFAIWLM